MQWQLCMQPLGTHDFTALVLPEASVLVLEHTLHSLSLQLQLNPVFRSTHCLNPHTW